MQYAVSGIGAQIVREEAERVRVYIEGVRVA